MVTESCVQSLRPFSMQWDRLSFSELLISQIIVPIQLQGSRIRLSPDCQGLMFSRPDCIKMCMEQLMLHCTAKHPARFALKLTSQHFPRDSLPRIQLST